MIMKENACYYQQQFSDNARGPPSSSDLSKVGVFGLRANGCAKITSPRVLHLVLLLARAQSPPEYRTGQTPPGGQHGQTTGGPKLETYLRRPAPISRTSTTSTLCFTPTPGVQKKVLH
ncbi:Hypothetical predicted protein [Xyrichtys novacula]|uniref:Uncharacterized protein n=1 Tax=Xyrichtys novacula TaxID=13765 RepID=A0AAV1G786_XYRNO|nr:Hypothetical predicted protein [Xyrichtys novacula]